MSTVLTDVEADPKVARFYKPLRSYFEVVMADMTARMFESSINILCRECQQKFPLRECVFKPKEVIKDGEATYEASYVCKECFKPQEVINFVKGNPKEPWLP